MVTKKNSVSLAEVVGYWLSYEYSGRRAFKEHIDKYFPDEIHLIVEKADYDGERANAKRLEMLRSYRKFLDWFTQAEWSLATLDEDDLAELLVIRAPHWEELSARSLKAIDIARRINEDEEGLLKGRNARRVNKIIRNISKKVKKPSRLVLTGARDSPSLTVIDGVHRAIRLCLYYLVKKAEKISSPQEAYLGITATTPQGLR